MSKANRANGGRVYIAAWVSEDLASALDARARADFTNASTIIRQALSLFLRQSVTNMPPAAPTAAPAAVGAESATRETRAC